MSWGNIKHVIASRKSRRYPFTIRFVIIRQFNCTAYVAGNLAEERAR